MNKQQTTLTIQALMKQDKLPYWMKLKVMALGIDPMTPKHKFIEMELKAIGMLEKVYLAEDDDPMFSTPPPSMEL